MHHARPSTLALSSALALILLGSACAESIAEPEPAEPAFEETSQALHRNKAPRMTRSERALTRKLGRSGGVDSYKLPASWQLSRIPQDPNNRLNYAKVLLGKFLYHETAILVNNVRPEGRETGSCASCHFVDAGLRTFRRQGIGEGGSGFFNREKRAGYANAELDVQPIRSPTTLNTAYQELMLWNGQFGATGANAGTQAQWTPGTPKETNFLGFEGLETQAIAGLGVHRMSFENSRVYNNPIYRFLFDLAFYEIPRADRRTDVNAGLAIAAYERTLLSTYAPWQRWLRGDRGKSGAMTRRQVRGANLFFGKADCVACHSGPALNSMSFHALGMGDLLGPDIFQKDDISDLDRDPDLGRGGFTQVPADNYKFKTPPLYNLKSGTFLGHGATFATVRDVIEYKNAGVTENPKVPASQVSPQFRPLGLSRGEVKALTDFVENALHDPIIGRFEPSRVPSGNCIPTNDPQARIDLGCT